MFIFWCCSTVTGREDLEETTELDTGRVIEATFDTVVKADVASESTESEQKDDELDDEPFTVILEMTPGERMGASLDILDKKTLRVAEVKQEGRMKTYNNSVSERLRVLPGHFIIEVNGKSGKAEEMIKELKQSRTWRLKVARHREFTVSVTKSGPLCLDLQFEKEGDCIVIRRIGDGVVKEYNSTVAEGEQIKVGDRICEVNDVRAPARTLLETLRADTELTMKIGRPHA